MGRLHGLPGVAYEDGAVGAGPPTGLDRAHGRQLRLRRLVPGGRPAVPAADVVVRGPGERPQREVERRRVRGDAEPARGGGDRVGHAERGIGFVAADGRGGGRGSAVGHPGHPRHPASTVAASPDPAGARARICLPTAQPRRTPRRPPPWPPRSRCRETAPSGAAPCPRMAGTPGRTGGRRVRACGQLRWPGTRRRYEAVRRGASSRPPATARTTVSRASAAVWTRLPPTYGAAPGTRSHG